MFKLQSLTLWLCLFWSAEAYSASGNYNSILIGDQAAGMGGAATAMMEDASAMSWYNPAALALLPGQSFSASVGVYKKYDTVYSAEADIIAAGFRSNQGFFRAIPSSSSSVIRPKQIPWLQDWTLALSIIVPTYDTYKGNVVDSETDTSTLAITDETLWTGGSMSKIISDKTSFGFTVYYTARSFTRSVTERTYNPADNTQFRIFTEDIAYTQNAIVSIFGLHHRMTPNWNFGFSVRPRSLKIAGKGIYTQNDIENGVVAPPKTFSSLDAHPMIPTRVNVGVAYVRPGSFTISGDLNFYEGFSFNDLSNLEISEFLEFKPIVNASLGMEYTWDRWLKLRAGVFSNLAATPNPDPKKTRSQGDHVDQAGFSANAAFISGPMAFTFGGYYTGGRGRSVQRVNHEYTVVPKIHNVFTMLIGTSYYF